MNNKQVVTLDNSISLTGARHIFSRQGKQLSGFTLIELLVVVLIIGILAAVALPQYQVAVAKSRLAAVKPILYRTKTELELLYLEKGNYPNTNTVSTTTNCRNVQHTGIRDCGNGFLINSHNIANQSIRVYYCPQNLNSWANCQQNYDIIYTIYLDHSQFPNRITCSGVSTVAKKVCAQENRY